MHGAVEFGALLVAVGGLMVGGWNIPLAAAEATAKALPHYQFSDGEQLTYKGQSNFKYDKSSTITSADWRITVVGKNADGSYRLILRLATSETRVAEGLNQNPAKEPEEVFFATADLSPSGELQERFSSFGTRNIRNVLPMLPVNEKQVTDGWETVGSFDSILRSHANSEVDGKFGFETVQEGPINLIYGVEQHDTVTFDLESGRVDQITSTTRQTYGINSSGTGDLKYIGSKSLDAKVCQDFAADGERFFAAKQKFEKATGASDAKPASFDQAIADFKQARSGLSSAEFQQHVDRLIDDFQKYRQYAEQQLKERTELIGQAADSFQTTDLDGKPMALNGPAREGGAVGLLVSRLRLVHPQHAATQGSGGALPESARRAVGNEHRPKARRREICCRQNGARLSEPESRRDPGKVQSPRLSHDDLHRSRRKNR